MALSETLVFDEFPENTGELNDSIRRYAKDRQARASAGIYLVQASGIIGLDRNLARGLGDFIAKRDKENSEASRMDIAILALNSLTAFTKITEAVPLAKATSFNYLPIHSRKPIDEQISSALDNAQEHIDTYGIDTFRHGAPRAYHRAPFPDSSGYSIAAKGGSGAGTFSIDLAIEYNKFEDDRDYLKPSHELWRTGLDIYRDDQGNTHGRIIRTGGGVKAHDTIKQDKFNTFLREYRTTPQRILTYLGAHLIHDQYRTNALALSSYGAHELSSLNKSQSAKPTPYSAIHEQSGFVKSYNEYWHLAPDIRNTFYDLFVSQNEVDAGIRPHEYRPCDIAVTAFNAMTNYPEGSAFPVKLCSNDDPNVVESAMRAFMSK